jgi:hypothetical protein
MRITEKVLEVAPKLPTQKYIFLYDVCFQTTLEMGKFTPLNFSFLKKLKKLLILNIVKHKVCLPKRNGQ